MALKTADRAAAKKAAVLPHRDRGFASQRDWPLSRDRPLSKSHVKHDESAARQLRHRALAATAHGRRSAVRPHRHSWARRDLASDAGPATADTKNLPKGGGAKGRERAKRRRRRGQGSGGADRQLNAGRR